MCTFGGAARDLGHNDVLEVTIRGKELGAGRLMCLRSDLAGRSWFRRGSRRIVRPATGLVPRGAGQLASTCSRHSPRHAHRCSLCVLLVEGFALIHGITGRMNIAHGEFATRSAPMPASFAWWADRSALARNGQCRGAGLGSPHISIRRLHRDPLGVHSARSPAGFAACRQCQPPLLRRSSSAFSVIRARSGCRPSFSSRWR